MFLTFLALVACRPELPAAECATSPWFADADGDGFGDRTTRVDACVAPPAFVADATDCEDTDPTVFPGAPERCDGVDQDCDAVVDNAPIDAVVVYVDVDGDGYAGAETTLACEGPLESSDCDDADPDVSPDAFERCDGVDEDCDGVVDEDAVDPSTWYADDDADGFGDADVATLACQAPAGHVADATDCDDGDATITPVATEVCDGIDQDCDGVADDDAADASLWYADADGDGVGDLAAMIAACEPAGVSFGGDCDDTDPTVSPNAAEHCDDRDEDCDGEVDDDAVDPATWYIDADSDGFGSALYVACAAVAGTVAAGADCDDGDPAISPGATELCSTAADDDCDGAVDDGADVSTWYEDLDDDDWGDAAAPVTACVDTRWLAATPGDCDPSDHAVYPGAIEWCNTVDDDCDGDIDEDSAFDAVSWYTDADGDAWGDTATLATACSIPTGGVSRGGDCDDTERAISPSAEEVCDGEDNDCDGTIDVDAVDASYSYADADGDGWGDDTTGVYACSLPAGFVRASGDCDDGDVAFNPEQADAWGDGVDADCDGYDDMIAASATDVVLRGEAANDHAGSGLAGADVDGDGYADVIVGADGAGAGGRAYLYYGPIAASGLLSGADVLFEGGAADDATGSFLRAGGDADGDGLPDLLVGATNASRAVEDGLVYVFTDVATASLASRCRPRSGPSPSPRTGGSTTSTRSPRSRP